MNRQAEIYRYLAGDFLASMIAWSLFFLYRKVFIEPQALGYEIPIKLSQNYYLAIVIIPLFWVSTYALLGTYRNIYRKSRLKELVTAFLVTLAGTVVLFFLFLLDDYVESYRVYWKTFLTLFGLQFFLLYLFRFIQLTRLKEQLKSGKIGFNTVMAGSNEKAKKLFTKLENEREKQGYNFIGYVTTEDDSEDVFEERLPKLGHYSELPSLIEKYQIEEVILAIDSSEHRRLEKIIGLLENEEVIIKVIPDMYDLITGMVKMNYIFGTALIEVTPGLIPQWQKNFKRLIDVIASTIVLVLLSPLYLILALLVKFSSKGPVYYRQERIGKDEKPFQIIKFRTMRPDAESGKPKLSSDADPRITPIGRFLRKYRLDELPQFYNVLVGDMSLVGPRPERQYFIDQIIQHAPHYKHLLRVRPGITSWGQIKFGYAENVEEMVERLEYDILYIENMSLAMDFKIMFYTVLIILKGKGK